MNRAVEFVRRFDERLAEESVPAAHGRALLTPSLPRVFYANHFSVDLGAEVSASELIEELEPVVLALGRWGSRAPFPPTDAQLSADSMVIALKTLFHAPTADDLDASYELRLGEQRFRATVAGGALELARGGADGPDATIEADTGTLAAVLWHGRRLTEALRSGDLRVDGDKQATRRFFNLFALAEPAA